MGGADDPGPGPAPEAKAAPEEPSLVEKARMAPMTFLLAAANIVVFLWAESQGSTVENPTLLRFGAMEPTHVWAGEYWRLGTSMFMHIGWIHLAWNTYASIGWCMAIERFLGARRFVLVYLLSGFAGSCLSAIMSVFFAEGRVSAGASGAMFGIVGATLAIRHKQLGSFKAFTSDPGIRSTFVQLAIWTAIGLTALRMDNSAHLGGLLAGAAATALFLERARLRWLVLAAAVMGLFLGAVRPWWTPKGDDAKRFALYSYGYLSGRSPAGDDSKWLHDEAKGVRFSEKGCSRGIGLSCLLLSEYMANKGDPPSMERAKELHERGCALDPETCKSLRPPGSSD